MVLLNDGAVLVVEGMCHNVHPHDCVDQNPLGNAHVGIVILESLIHSDVHPTQRFLLCRWPVWSVMFKGVSLCDHERCHMQIQEELQATMWPRKGLRMYDSLACVPHSMNKCKHS